MIDVGDRCPVCDEEELVLDEATELLYCVGCDLFFEEDDA